MSSGSDPRQRVNRCPYIHPVEGVRCEKNIHDSSDEHKVSNYWTGGDSLRWMNPEVPRG